ncbi:MULTISPECIES: helix-turn-helix transcriptional regulator [Brevundimonas]|jgi:transcriptional regulator with XRE-family HTH domain|uniref:helix-turn-helix domain-containing protein n=1 Tax=Brevundimonas TaxID=41275 RepID=UPI000DB2940D|nr:MULTISPECIES: helix-turn-helix transcriptional regulator [Brevundimonas]MBJ7485304.1 helix-turn-helix transcriptional regulator [Brevundimonas sp.]PZU72485.1 MAG: transcriptional regulator [Brevundimonas sp.]HAF81449.1 transcriptional regulator [Brevundimonas sp.]
MPTDAVTLLARNLQTLLRAAGLSQEELAFRAGTKRSYLSDLERGVRNPSVRLLGRLAEVLDVPPARLLQ